MITNEAIGELEQGIATIIAEGGNEHAPRLIRLFLEANYLAPLIELVENTVDDTPCRLDHHGYCQQHSWLYTDPPCRQVRIRQLAERGIVEV